MVNYYVCFPEKEFLKWVESKLRFKRSVMAAVANVWGTPHCTQMAKIPHLSFLPLNSCRSVRTIVNGAGWTSSRPKQTWIGAVKKDTVTCILQRRGPQ